MTDDTAAPPKFTVTGAADEFLVSDAEVGQPCVLCTDRALALGEVGIRVPTDQGEKLNHAICFYALRSSDLEQQLQQLQAQARGTHQSLCAVIAKMGKIRITPYHIERGLQFPGLDFEKTADGGVAIGPKRSSSIEIVGKMPGRA